MLFDRICSRVLCFPDVQQQLKRLRLKRKEMQEQINRGKQLQVEEGLEESLQEDLEKLECTLSKMDQSIESQEQDLEVRKEFIFCISVHTVDLNQQITTALL